MGISEGDLKELGLGVEDVTETITEAKPLLPCEKCKGDSEKNCKECGCMECGGKTPEDQLLVCEVCTLFGSALFSVSFFLKLNFICAYSN